MNPYKADFDPENLEFQNLYKNAILPPNINTDFKCEEVFEGGITLNKDSGIMAYSLTLVPSFEQGHFNPVFPVSLNTIQGKDISVLTEKKTFEELSKYSVGTSFSKEGYTEMYRARIVDIRIDGHDVQKMPQADFQTYGEPFFLFSWHHDFEKPSNDNFDILFAVDHPLYGITDCKISVQIFEENFYTYFYLNDVVFQMVMGSYINPPKKKNPFTKEVEPVYEMYISKYRIAEADVAHRDEDRLEAAAKRTLTHNENLVMDWKYFADLIHKSPPFTEYDALGTDVR